MLPSKTADEKFIRAAITLAKRAGCQTSPNPTVGAIIVRNGRIIGKGFHTGPGHPHAEIEAIRSLKNPNLAHGATIYISLEPCSTHGRTPPCTTAILEHGFARVVYGATDPNPKHAGRACGILRNANIAVTSGILETECAALNATWNHWILTGTPYVIAKCGMSLDGRIASHPDSRWITSAASRADAMQLRTRVDAILVGGTTVRIDNPQLTLRGTTGRQPWRVIWSRSGRIPKSSHLLRDAYKARTLICKSHSFAELLTFLGKKEITSLLVEGGGRTLGAAFDANFVNEVVFYVAPRLLGGKPSAVDGIGVASNADAIALKNIAYKKIGADLRISGVPCW